MAFYRECPLCGASLDPGEKCTCQEEKEQEERKHRRMFRTGRNGQLCFGFAEERSCEKTVM